MKKLRVGILFGGRSGEHKSPCFRLRPFSMLSIKTSMTLCQFGITKEGRGEIIRCRETPENTSKTDGPWVIAEGDSTSCAHWRTWSYFFVSGAAGTGRS